MLHTEYIVEILGHFEGKAIPVAYIPKDKAGNVLGVSGVTIGTGFDLGQQSEKDVKGLGLSEELYQKLIPYIGLKKEAAAAKLSELPLTLESEEISEIDKAVHKKYINETADMFGVNSFDAAPKQVQAVAVSLHYQFGTPRRIASPALGQAWDALTAGKYKEAAECLTDVSGWSPDHRLYMSRRKQEAALLRDVV